MYPGSFFLPLSLARFLYASYLYSLPRGDQQLTPLLDVQRHDGSIPSAIGRSIRPRHAHRRQGVLEKEKERKKEKKPITLAPNWRERLNLFFFSCEFPFFSTSFSSSKFDTLLLRTWTLWMVITGAAPVSSPPPPPVDLGQVSVVPGCHRSTIPWSEEEEEEEEEVEEEAHQRIYRALMNLTDLSFCILDCHAKFRLNECFSQQRKKKSMSCFVPHSRTLFQCQVVSVRLKDPFIHRIQIFFAGQELLCSLWQNLSGEEKWRLQQSRSGLSSIPSSSFPPIHRSAFSVRRTKRSGEGRGKKQLGRKIKYLLN